MTDDPSPTTTDIVQITLAGDPTESARERPETLLWCDETEQWVLRSLQWDWPHELHASPDDVPPSDSSSTSSSPDDDEDDEPREVGGVFSVSLSYDVTYHKTIIAATEDQAVDLAKDELDFREDCPSDAIHLHDDAHKQETLTEDDDRCEAMPGWPW